MSLAPSHRRLREISRLRKPPPSIRTFHCMVLAAIMLLPLAAGEGWPNADVFGPDHLSSGVWKPFFNHPRDIYQFQSENNSRPKRLTIHPRLGVPADTDSRGVRGYTSLLIDMAVKSGGSRVYIYDVTKMAAPVRQMDLWNLMCACHHSI